MRASRQVLTITSHLALAAVLVASTEAQAQDPSSSSGPAGAEAAAPATPTPQTQPVRSEQHAENASDQAEAAEIVVTAQFRAQNLQDTPLAITAVTSEMLEARSQTNIIDIGAFSPNVNLSPAAAIQGSSIAAFIRGIGQEDASFALEPGVGIYIDDVYYGTTFGAVLDLTDLDRVEVLRGPQGTLAGKNSLGGAIKLFSKKPDSDGGGYVEATYGRYDRIDLRASAGFTIADGLYARISGVSNHRDGFFKRLDYGCVNPGQGIAATTGKRNCRLGIEGGTDLIALRGAIRYAPDDSPLEINFIADMARNDSEPVPTKITFANYPLARTYVPGDPLAGVPFDSRFLTGPESATSYASYTEGGNFSTIFGGFPTQVVPGSFPDEPKNTANSYGFTGTIDYALSDSLSLKSITAWRKAYGTTVLDIDGSPVNILKERLGNTHKQFTQELRLSGNVGDLADFTVGGFYYDANDRAEYRIQIPTFLYDFETDDPVDNRSVAAFAHLELHPTDKLNIIGGIRYTDDKKTYTFGRRNVDGTPISGIPLTTNFLVAGLDGLSATFKDDRIDYRLGVNYHWSDALMTYAQVSTGYKGGGINPRPFVPDQVLTFDAETLTTYEAGLKADLFDRILRANGAVFYNEYKDIQRTVFVCPFSVSTTCSAPSNAGDAHSQGAELELFLRPIDGLSIDGAVSYLDFEYDEINPFTGVTLDMEAPFHNKWQASAGVQYEADLGGAGTLTPRLDWTYQSSFYYQAVNSPFNRIEGRNLFNARLSYESPDENWLVSASVTNLTNKFYYVAASENIANFGVSTNVVGRPREWALTVRRKF